MELGELGGLILLGAAVGLATNLLVVPPLRHRWGQSSVRSLAKRVSGELSDIAREMGDASLTEDEVQEWSNRVRDLPDLVEQTRRNLEDAAETLRFNPRRLLFRSRPSFIGYRYILSALSRVVDQLNPIIRSVAFLAGDDSESEREKLVRSVGDVLDSAAGAIRFLGEIHSFRDLQEEQNELQHCIDDARTSTHEIRECLSPELLAGPGSWPAYEALHADARRLVEDVAHAERELSQLAD